MRKILIVIGFVSLGAVSAAAQDQSVQTVNGAAAPAPAQAAPPPGDESQPATSTPQPIGMPPPTTPVQSTPQPTGTPPPSSQPKPQTPGAPGA